MTVKEDEMEKLVEEIRGYWCEDCQCRDPDSGECFEMAEDHCRRVVGKSIARIGKAYVDGLPLLGEVGRAVWVKQGDEDHICDWVADVIENGVRTFIALCPEKGEEKDESETV